MVNQQPVPRIDMSNIVMPKVNATQLAAAMSNIDFYRTTSFPDGVFDSSRVHERSSQYLLGSIMAQGAAFNECLSPDESDLLLADGTTDELRWSFGELWDSYTGQQQRLIKLGFLGGLFVAIFMAIFMAQTLYPEFGQFVERAGAPEALASLVLTWVGPNLMTTKTHPINKRIRRN